MSAPGGMGAEPSDEDLMAAASRGDREAFGRLVFRHQDFAWRVSYRFLGRAAEAEDIAQQAFLNILKAAGRYEAAASFRTYLHRVLTRLCIDFVEKKKPALGEDTSRAPSASPAPPDRAAEREEGEAVLRALRQLPVRQRMAVVLRYSEGLSLRESAEAMGTTEKALEGLLARARETLEGGLADFLGK